jgi:hypothetical protein
VKLVAPEDRTAVVRQFDMRFDSVSYHMSKDRVNLSRNSKAGGVFPLILVAVRMRMRHAKC